MKFFLLIFDRRTIEKNERERSIKKSRTNDDDDDDMSRASHNKLNECWFAVKIDVSGCFFNKLQVTQQRLNSKFKFWCCQVVSHPLWTFSKKFFLVSI